MQKKGLYLCFLKRTFDLSISLIAFILLLPILVIVSILVRLKLGSPIIFKQVRPGLDEKEFILYKFRTMTNKKDVNGDLLPDGERLTKFGKFLRSTSFDELPSLINIVKGEMSLVGPRPQLIKDLLFMSGDELKRHSVKPGLTGLAQISGRNNISWEEKFYYDLKYINNMSFSLDLKILFLTFLKVILRKDITTNGMETAEDYGDYLLRENIISAEEYEKKMYIINQKLGDNNE